MQPPPSTENATTPLQLVKRAVAENRLAHALLIYGQHFGQVQDFAYQAAAHLLGLPVGDQAEEELLRHPDVFTLRPSKKSRIISVDDTRELIRNIQHSPQRGLRKVALIFEVDRLHDSAANAFLKTLEEPPLNTTIFLLTTRPHSLLATIRSRCQRFRLPTAAAQFDDEDVQRWLQSYRQWLDDLTTGGPGGKQSVPHFLLGLYALIERYSQIIATLGKQTWKEMSQSLPEEMDDDERLALESRISISIRQDFLAAIEQETEAFARAQLPSHPQAGHKLTEAIRALEEATSLLRLNLRAEPMLESFLLRSLRIWTAK